MILTSAHWEALEQTRSLSPTPKNLDRVSAMFGSEISRWAFTQWELRKRAESKFSHASEMLFTREALEQSTSERLAEYHASKFPGGVRVADLCCGIGADLIALARRGEAVGYEIDPERLAYAQHNLRVHGLEAELRSADCLVDEWDFDFAFADPARRREGRRTLKLEEFSPSLLDLRNRAENIQLFIIKLTPMISDAEIRSLSNQVEFLSYRRECRELLITFSPKHAPSTIEAVLVGDAPQRLLQEDLNSVSDVAEEWVYEADPAAIRAHCLGTLCQQFGLVGLGDSNGYLTSNSAVDSPWLMRFRLIEDCGGEVKQVRHRLQMLDAARPVIKCRGLDLDPEKLAKQLGSFGKTPVIVLAYPIGKKVRYLIVKNEDLRT